MVRSTKVVCRIPTNSNGTPEGFWFLVCYAAIQLALHLQQESIAVLRSTKVVRGPQAPQNGGSISSVQSYFFPSLIGARTLQMPVPCLPQAPNVESGKLYPDPFSPTASVRPSRFVSFVCLFALALPFHIALLFLRVSAALLQGAYSHTEKHMRGQRMRQKIASRKGRASSVFSPCPLAGAPCFRNRFFGATNLGEMHGPIHELAGFVFWYFVVVLLCPE